MRALHITLLTAKRAWVVTMTRSTARVLAAGVIALAWLLALPVFFVLDFSLYAWTTLATLVSASVAAWLQRSARRAAVVLGSCNVYAARQSDFVIAAWNNALDQGLADCQARILILPTRQLGYMVSTRQLDVDVRDLDGTVLIALLAAYVLAGVFAAFLDSVAGLEAVRRLMNAVGMTLVDT
jgi:hypothetical protein